MNQFWLFRIKNRCPSCYFFIFSIRISFYLIRCFISKPLKFIYIRIIQTYLFFLPLSLSWYTATLFPDPTFVVL